MASWFASPTSINASSGIGNFFEYLSVVTNFWFGRMILIAIFVIFLMGYLRSKEGDIVGGVAVASYVSFVMGLLFWVLGLISGLDFSIAIGIMLISSITLLLQKKDY